MYWAKQIAGAVGGGIGGIGGKSVTALSADPIDYKLIGNKGGMSKIAPIKSMTSGAAAAMPAINYNYSFNGGRTPATNGASAQESSGGACDACIVVNPGGEETWEGLRRKLTKNSKSPFVVLNNAYSTAYGLGNKKGYEEAYYLKRITRGWVFRAFPGPWKTYLEKPDGSTELLRTDSKKPELRQIAEVVREESFKRYAIGNDRWMTNRL